MIAFPRYTAGRSQPATDALFRSRVMPARSLVLDYDGERVTFNVEGETAWGDTRVLLDDDDNLIAGRAWERDGFVIAPFLDPAHYERLQEAIRTLLAARIAETGLQVPGDFALERYHDVVT